MRRIFRGLGALIILAVGLVGVPWLLIIMAGNPLPTELDLHSFWQALTRPDDGTILIRLVAFIAWIAWLVFAISVVAELIAALTRQRIRVRLPGLAGPQKIAGGLVLLVIAMLVTPHQFAAAAPGSDHPVRPTTTTSETTAPPRAAAPVDSATGRPGTTAPEAAEADTVVHTVQPGDDLWTLSEHYYGQGQDWRRIARANPSLLTGGPDRLEPGWRLRVPGVDPGLRRVVVRAGDSLSAIAEREYGDASAWHRIYHANRGVLSDPDLLPIGLSLVLPPAPDHADTDQVTSDNHARTSGTLSDASGAPTATGGTAPGNGGRGQASGAPAPAPTTPPTSAPTTAATTAPTTASTTSPTADAGRARAGGPEAGSAGAGTSNAGRAGAGGAGAGAAGAGTAGTGTAGTGSAGAGTAGTGSAGAGTAGAGRAGAGSAGAGASGAGAAEPGTAEVGAAAGSGVSYGVSAHAIQVAGIGGLMAAAVIGGLATRRQLQLRTRTVGRRIPQPPPAAQQFEAELGRRQLPKGLELLNLALRAIGRDCHQHGRSLPGLQAARSADDGLLLLMAEPDLPAPTGFVVEGHQWWLAPAAADTFAEDGAVIDAAQPYPGLTSLGTAPDGAVVLVNLEAAGLFSVGDPDRDTAAGVLTAMATELAFSPWADELVITLVGDDHGLADSIDRYNVSTVPGLDHLLDRWEQRARVQRDHLRADPAAAAGDYRIDPDLADPWVPEVGLILSEPDAWQAERLERLLLTDPPVTIAAVVIGDQLMTDWQLIIDGARSAELAPLGWPLSPQLITRSAGELMTDLISTTGSPETEPAPWWAVDFPDGAQGPARALPGPPSDDQPDVVSAEDQYGNPPGSVESRTEPELSDSRATSSATLSGTPPAPSSGSPSGTSSGTSPATSPVTPPGSSSSTSPGTSSVRPGPATPVTRAPNSSVPPLTTSPGPPATTAPDESPITAANPARVGSEPVGWEPVGSEPVGWEPVGPAPGGPAPGEQGPGRSEPGEQGPVGSEPGEQGPVGSEPGEPAQPTSRPVAPQVDTSNKVVDLRQISAVANWPSIAVRTTEEPLGELVARSDADWAWLTPPGRPRASKESVIVPNPFAGATPHAPRHPTIMLLGPAELLGAAGEPPHRAVMQCIEYCTWLLEHPGSTAQAMAAGLAVAEGTRRSNMSRLRNWLGSDDQGEPYLPDAYSGKIRLSPLVSSDWHRLQLLTHAGVNRTSTEGLAKALDLVRGAPLADAAPLQWHWAEEMRTDMVSVVRDIGVELTDRALTRSDIDLARWAASRALTAAPQDEFLIGARIRTEHQAGNPAEVERLALQLAAQGRALGVDLHPETVDLLQQVMEGRLRARA